MRSCWIAGARVIIFAVAAGRRFLLEGCRLRELVVFAIITYQVAIVCILPGR